MFRIIQIHPQINVIKCHQKSETIQHKTSRCTYLANTDYTASCRADYLQGHNYVRFYIKILTIKYLHLLVLLINSVRKKIYKFLIKNIINNSYVYFRNSEIPRASIELFFIYPNR